MKEYTEKDVLKKLAFNPLKLSNEEKIRYIEEGKYIQELSADPDPFIRFKVASAGHCLEELINDPDQYVNHIARWELFSMKIKWPKTLD